MMYAPENQNSNERESAAQIDETTKAIVEVRKELYVAISAINKAWELARKDCDAVRHLGTEEWLKALSKAERVVRTRDLIEEALGNLNRLEK